MTVSPRIPDLPALDALATVAHCGSMGAAAVELGVSQQAVSARIRTAERLLGVAVFSRSPRGVTPTAAGRSVLVWAESVLRAVAELDAGVAGLRGDARASATVAVSHTVSEWLFPTWAARLRREQPNAHITTRLANSHEVFEAVRGGSVDLGFVESPDVPRDLDSLDITTDELVVVVSPDHPWATAGRAVTVAQVAATPMVARERGSGTRATIDAGIARAGYVRVPPLMELGSTASIRSAVLATGAPAVLSSLSVRRDIEDGRLVAIPVSDGCWPRVLRAVWNRHQRPTGIAADLLRLAAASGRAEA